MASTISKTRRSPQASRAVASRPKGLALLVTLGSLQGFISLGVFARWAMWGSNGSADALPDPSLTSVFANTALFQTSLGPLTVGDVSLWVERAVLVGLCLSVGWFALRMRAHK